MIKNKTFNISITSHNKDNDCVFCNMLFEFEGKYYTFTLVLEDVLVLIDFLNSIVEGRQNIRFSGTDEDFYIEVRGTDGGREIEFILEKVTGLKKISLYYNELNTVSSSVGLIKNRLEEYINGNNLIIGHDRKHKHYQTN